MEITYCRYIRYEDLSRYVSTLLPFYDSYLYMAKSVVRVPGEPCEQPDITLMKVLDTF